MMLGIDEEYSTGFLFSLGKGNRAGNTPRLSYRPRNSHKITARKKALPQGIGKSLINNATSTSAAVKLILG